DCARIAPDRRAAADLERGTGGDAYRARVAEPALDQCGAARNLDGATVPAGAAAKKRSEVDQHVCTTRGADGDRALVVHQPLATVVNLTGEEVHADAGADCQRSHGVGRKSHLVCIAAA